MKYLLLLLSLFYCHQIVVAQQPQPPLPEVEWKIDEAGRYRWDSYDNADPYEKSIVHLNASEAVAGVRFSKGEYGVVKVNENGTVAWECRLPGLLMGLGKMGDKVIAFYEMKGNFGQIHAVSIGVDKGEKLLDKIVHQGREDAYDAITIQNRPSGVFNDLLIRATSSKIRKGMIGAGFPSELRASSLSCKAVFLDANLESVRTVDMKADGNDTFLGSVVNEEGNIYICHKAEDEMVVDEYNGNSGAANRLQVSLETKKGSAFYPVFGIDAQNGQNVLAAVNYHNRDKDFVFQVFQFDFKEKKAGSSDARIQDKSYAKSIETVEAKDVYKAGLTTFVESLYPVKILRVSDKLVVIREIRRTDIMYENGRSTGTVHYRSGPAVVSFLDNQLRPLKDLAFIKQFEVFVDVARTLGVHVQNDKLYLVTVSLTGIAAYSNAICTINTSTMSSEKYEIVRKLTLGAGVMSEPNATIWFDHSLLLNQLISKGLLRVKDINTVLQKVTL